MGDEDSALVDAGPILHLDEVGSLPLLQLFRTIHVPDGVWSETVGRRRIPGSRLLALGNLVRHSAPSAEVARFVRQHGLQALQGGERECLYLARDTGSTMLLTDDLAAREAAGRLGLAPVGSLGIVVRAYQLGRLNLTEAEHLIRVLHGRSSLFVTSAIAELAIERLRSSP